MKPYLGMPVIYHDPHKKPIEGERVDTLAFVSGLTADPRRVHLFEIPNPHLDCELTGAPPFRILVGVPLFEAGSKPRGFAHWCEPAPGTPEALPARKKEPAEPENAEPASAPSVVPPSAKEPAPAERTLEPVDDGPPVDPIEDNRPRDRKRRRG